MKYIPKLDTIFLTNLQGDAIVDNEKKQMTLTVQSFLIQRLLDNKFGTNAESLVTVSQIKKAIENSRDNGSEYIAIETSDWNKLVEVVKVPSSPYNTNIAHCLVPVINAILGAKDSVD